MESEEVSLLLIHEHLMMPWNDLRRGDCCGRLGFTSGGYYCKSCDFYVHMTCIDESPEAISEHPSHSVHTLKLQSRRHICDSCDRSIVNLCYRCEICDFDVDLFCAKYPPPEVIDNFETHPHKLTLLKERVYFDCDAKCGKDGEGFPYKCHECDVSFHVDCVWNPPESKHLTEYTTMESEGVSLPFIHEHVMMPWNILRRGDCCGRVGFDSGGYYCKTCDFFIHRKCVDDSPEAIREHPSHSFHTLRLECRPGHSCDLCDRSIVNLCYRCEICDFDVDLYCAKYPPPEIIDIFETHHHKLTLLKERIYFDCDAKCGKVGQGFPYICDECDITFHVDCVWNPPESKHPTEYTTMESKGVSLPFIHEHVMMPWNILRIGDCCGRLGFDSGGYYCKRCDFFVHRKCVDDSPEAISEHPSHSVHTLKLQSKPYNLCDLCDERIKNLCYRCEICDFSVDLYCAKYPPPEVIDISEIHHHELTLLKCWNYFPCDAKCGKDVEGFTYKCFECDVAFHVDCVWNPPEAKHLSEVNHTYHPLHPLKLHTGQPPDYSDGKCRLCGTEIGILFYHCSACNFSLDLRCVLDPPPQSVLDLKVHAHQLIFRPRLDSFTCNACGLSGDRSPYICVQCDFMIHQECLALPRLININRHDHRVSRTSVLGVVNSVCGVCHQKVDWTWGGYSCQRCPDYVVHSKCATRKDVWNGIELEGVPEETEDIEPYVVIDDNTIQHFSHKEHYQRFHADGLLCEENKRCSACTHPICLQSFYGCIDCDFILHQKCAESPRKKWHVLHNDRLTLVISVAEFFWCDACDRMSNGFMYQCGSVKLDVLCGSISEPFVHPSHPHHPLYYILQVEEKKCNGCNKGADHLLTCIESGSGFVLCFRCATLPQVVKHRVDDHPLSLCYGEKENGKYWCDICEKEMNPNTWFYTCKDHRASLHTRCVLGDFLGLMPRSTIDFNDISFEVVLNNGITRPFCWVCDSRCMYPISLKMLGTSDLYVCSLGCIWLCEDKMKIK